MRIVLDENGNNIGGPKNMAGASNWFTSGIGDLVNDITGVTSTNKFNAQQAQIQRDWETYMSNTAYQRAMADMESAGLNPAMMYASGGQGASTPTGASASGKAGGFMNVLGNVGNFINSITNARKVDAMTKQNELHGNTATRLYKSAEKIAKYLEKYY